MSPISDTTVLSSLACDCDLIAHVSTQAPYALMMSLFSILCGTLPIGYRVWPNIISFIIGWVLIGVCVYVIGRRVVNATGSFSPFLELWLRFVKKGNSELEVLRVDTVKCFQEEEVVTAADKEEGSEEDNLVKTKDGSVGEEAPVFHDEEAPDVDEKDFESAVEAVPVDDPVSKSAPRDSMHSEASIEA